MNTVLPASISPCVAPRCVSRSAAAAYTQRSRARPRGRGRAAPPRGTGVHLNVGVELGLVRELLAPALVVWPRARERQQDLLAGGHGQARAYAWPHRGARQGRARGV